MWVRMFHRFGKRLGKLTTGGVIMLIAAAGMFIFGSCRLPG
jgi:hypothetical protein